MFPNSSHHNSSCHEPVDHVGTIVIPGFIRIPRRNLPLSFDSSAPFRQVEPISSSGQIDSIPSAAVKEGQREPRFCSRARPMPQYSTTIRFRFGFGPCSRVTLLVSSCREVRPGSSARSTDPNLEPVPSAPSAPFFRSYERSPRPYDVDREPLPPMPPTEVPAVPGYSEPELAVPPSPTTQKKRRPWIPSAKKPKPAPILKHPSVDQIGASSSDQGSRGLQGKSQRRSTTSPNEFPELKSRQHRSIANFKYDSAAINQWSPAATGDGELGGPGHSGI